MNENRELFERELQRMLSVDPPPDLQRRVRARAFAAPAKRTPWFALCSGLAGVAATIVLLMMYNPVKPAVIISNPQEAGVRSLRSVDPAPPVQPDLKPQTRQLARRSRSAQKSNTSVAILTRVASPAVTPLETARMEVPPLKVLELTNSLQPIPQPVFSIANLQPFNIEPPVLAVHPMGVSE